VGQTPRSARDALVPPFSGASTTAERTAPAGEVLDGLDHDQTLRVISYIALGIAGNAVVAANVGLATFRAYYTEVNARLLLQARTLDGPIMFLEPDEAAKADELHQRGYIRQWELWKQELDGRK